MMIQSAERFGLSQLHQLRGRVGRGAHKSYCLVHSDSPGLDARERLGIIERLRDGFELSEEDLRIRGPGDYLGTRQSGFAEFKIASLFDRELMDLARKNALSLMETDPRLKLPIHAPLASRVKLESDRMLGEIS
jgi:ATP-dependent DNA helicase RecG